MTKEVTAEIISIGDELLIGQTMNTNAGWMGEQLATIGIRVTLVRTIGDDGATILATLASVSSDVVLITGGLGPTKDDITKNVLCQFFDTGLEHRADVHERIQALFDRLGRRPMDVDLAQADLPVACTTVPNERGTASGMWFEKDGRVFVSMPGVPYEMKAMMGTFILPKLVQRFNTPVIVHRTVLTTGLGESRLAAVIADWENDLASANIKLAYLPSPGVVKLRLSLYAGADEAQARSVVNAKVGALQRLIPDL
ncbi:MAG TPA: molybdopterin-binding protein, partial [Flavobacteriales bacterium]|nr:molybdopterin-binding protein [Flavobacteriales bacterium]